MDSVCFKWRRWILQNCQLEVVETQYVSVTDATDGNIALLSAVCSRVHFPQINNEERCMESGSLYAMSTVSAMRWQCVKIAESILSYFKGLTGAQWKL